MGETKIVYHIGAEDTPYLVCLPISPEGLCVYVFYILEFYFRINFASQKVRNWGQTGKKSYRKIFAESKTFFLLIFKWVIKKYVIIIIIDIVSDLSYHIFKVEKYTNIPL